MKGAYQYYKEMPTWAKGVTVVGVLLVGYIAVKKGYQIVDNAIMKAKAKKSLKDIAVEQKVLEESGIRPSYSESQYKAWADSIQKQFDGCDVSMPVPVLPGVDLSYSGKVLYNILLQLKNDMDFLKLVKAWGTRTYDQCGWFTGDVENATLYAAVSDELRSGEIKILNETLAGQGISYRF